MEFLNSLLPLIIEWLNLTVRWIHVIVGIAWIGTSFYFNWLDSRLDRNIDKEDLEGELWSVHSGGFYNINKLKGPPKKFPKELILSGITRQDVVRDVLLTPDGTSITNLPKETL